MFLPVLLSERYLRILISKYTQPLSSEPFLSPYLMIPRLKEFSYTYSETKMMPAQYAFRPFFPFPTTALMRYLLKETSASRSATSLCSHSRHTSKARTSGPGLNSARGILSVYFVYCVARLPCIIYQTYCISHHSSIIQDAS